LSYRGMVPAGEVRLPTGPLYSQLPLCVPRVSKTDNLCHGKRLSPSHATIRPSFRLDES
jgi:hypothetical protein